MQIFSVHHVQVSGCCEILGAALYGEMSCLTSFFVYISDCWKGLLVF